MLTFLKKIIVLPHLLFILKSAMTYWFHKLKINKQAEVGKISANVSTVY